MAETLQELISKHTIPLKELDGSINVRGVKDPRNIIDTIEKLQSVKTYECEIEQLNGVVGDLISDYFTLILGQKYDRVISDELFKLEREIPITKDTSLYERIEQKVGRSIDNIPLDNLRIPLIARVDYGESSWQYEGKIHVEGRDRYSDRLQCDVPFDIKVKTPRLSRDVKIKVAEALRCAFDVCTKAMKNQIVGDYICSYPAQTLRNDLMKARLNIIWKPSLDQMNIGLSEPENVRILHRDPALLLRFYGKNYLVTTWSVHGEEPLEHYLKEYVEVLPFDKKKK